MLFRILRVHLELKVSYNICCKYRKNIRKFQIIEEVFSNSIYYRLWFPTKIVPLHSL